MDTPTNTLLEGIRQALMIESVVPGRWYRQVFKNGDSIYFRGQSVLKNGSIAGFQVDYYIDSPRPKNAKKTTVKRGFADLWKEIPESDVPPNVLAKFQAVL